MSPQLRITGYPYINKITSNKTTAGSSVIIPAFQHCVDVSSEVQSHVLHKVNQISVSRSSILP